MMRSLYSGVSGLKNHQIRMDVIGNNVSNVNTHGYKSERATFMDMISQNVSGASEPQDNIGGINPKQIGLGMMFASIDKIMTQGSLQTTGNNTDLAVSGEGFFVLGKGDKEYYSRAGLFSVDKEGFYVHTPTGMRVKGWNANQDGELNSASTSLENVRIPLYVKTPAKETNFVRFASNLNQNLEIVPADIAPANLQAYFNSKEGRGRIHTTTINIFDSQGEEHELKLEFYKTAINTWAVNTSLADATNVSVNTLGSAPKNTSNFQLSFNPNGSLANVSDGTDALNTGSLAVDLNFSVAGDPTLRNIRLDLGSVGLYDGITQFAANSTTKAAEQDGYTMGYLEAFVIDQTGTVTGTFSNGVKQALAQVALATFSNPAGLEKEGETKFSYSLNSGDPNIGRATDEGKGLIQAGVLEMSNVDLAEQFTDMIVTQRGFQANSRSITTSDQMLQELLTLKR